MLPGVTAHERASGGDDRQRYLDAVGALGDLTRRGAESAVRALVRRGEVAADAAESLVDDLLARSDRNRRWIAAQVAAETERTVARLGLARQRDLDRAEALVAALTARVDALEARLEDRAGLR
jgi:polyhydroxyalkanoate synthesis regulator phasin